MAKWQHALMTFEEAKQELETRLCLWANSEWEREIAESFPNFRLFKSGTPWQTYQFLQRLPKNEQLMLARALLERCWPDASAALENDCSADGELLLLRCDDFFRIRGLYKGLQRLEKEMDFTQAKYLFKMIREDAIKVVGGCFENDGQLRSRLDVFFESVPPTFEEDLFARKYAGEKVEFVNKRAIKKVMKAKYLAAFDDQIKEPEYAVAGEPDLTFKMRCCGWVLTTDFFFGGNEHALEYDHSITNENTSERLVYSISFCSWMGMGGTEWRYLTADEVEPACENTIRFCRQFFELAPKLLKGLELEKITAS